MPFYILLPSEVELEDGLLSKRFPLFDSDNCCVGIVSPNIAEKVCNLESAKLPINLVALLVTHKFFANYRKDIVKWVSDGLIEGIIIHPGGVNSPGQSDVESVLKYTCKITDDTERKTLARKTVAFSIADPNNTHGIDELKKLWQWLFNRNQELCPCPARQELSNSYKRLWHFETLGSLLNLVIQLEGIAFPVASNEHRSKWANDLKKVFLNEEWQWLRESTQTSGKITQFMASVGAGDLGKIATDAAMLLGIIKNMAREFSGKDRE